MEKKHEYYLYDGDKKRTVYYYVVHTGHSIAICEEFNKRRIEHERKDWAIICRANTLEEARSRANAYALPRGLNVHSEVYNGLDWCYYWDCVEKEDGYHKIPTCPY